MIWLLSRLVVVPVKAATRGFKLGLWTGRTVGVGRLVLVGLGVGIGLLVAPGPGARLRQRLRSRFGPGSQPRYQPSPVPASATGGAVVIGTEEAGGTVAGAAADRPVDVAALIEEPVPAVPDADPAVVPPEAPPA